MKNLFSSPADAGLIKIYSNLDMLLNEQRKQRADLAQILRMLNTLINNDNSQKQVDEFYESSPQPVTGEVLGPDGS